jgi:hypothetical protein
VTWKEIWRAKSEYGGRAAYLNGYYNEKGDLVKGELFIENHIISGRTMTVSMNLDMNQLLILLRVLEIDLEKPGS